MSDVLFVGRERELEMFDRLCAAAVRDRRRQLALVARACSWCG
jgi:hypothetical protein